MWDKCETSAIDCHRSLSTLILAKDADGEHCQMPLQSQETGNENYYAQS